MKTLSFAVAVALVTATHADEPLWWARRDYFGIHDATVLIAGWRAEPCSVTRATDITRPGQVPVVFPRTCDEAETRYREELWARHLRVCSATQGAIERRLNAIKRQRAIRGRGSMTITERATVAVFGLLLACIFGVLLAWIFLTMSVAVGTDDKGKTGTSTEKIEIIRVFPVLTDTQDRFMLIGGTDKREGYWIDPETGEQVKILPSHPIHVIPIFPNSTPDRFMLIGQDVRG